MSDVAAFMCAACVSVGGGDFHCQDMGTTVAWLVGD